MVCSMILRDHQRYTLLTKPFGYVLGPGGNSTNPSEPARLRKSPDPFGGRGFTHGRPHSSCSMATGRKYARGGWNVTGEARARRSGGRRLVPMASAMAGMT